MIDDFLNYIKDKAGEENYNFTFKTSDFIINDNNIQITSPNLYLKTVLKERYLPLMIEAFREISKSDTVPEFIFYIKENDEEDIVLRPPDEISKKNSDIQPKNPFHNNPNLNSKYTFENFVVGDNNQFAQAAATAVANSPGKQFNPLFIYAGVGLGKTHLMQAIGHHVHNHFKDLKVLYMTSEEFTNKYISSLGQQKTKEFREKIRHIDLLLIDDIQFLVGKEQMQEEFFHTFNTLYSSEKQLVITSDRPPKDHQSLEDRLRSRFECGLQADIQPPKYETRVAILKKLCEENNVIFSNEVVDFIASNIKSNVRELEGAFKSILAYKMVMNVEIDIELAMKRLKDIIPEISEQKNISTDSIIHEVSKYYGIEISNLLSDKKTHNIAFSRQTAMYLCRDLTDLSLTEIGKVFGKDHSTISYAVKEIKRKIKEDNSLLNLINTLKKNINNNY